MYGHKHSDNDIIVEDNMINEIREVKQCNTNGIIELDSREEIVNISDSNLDISIREEEVIIPDWLEKNEDVTEEYRTRSGRNITKNKSKNFQYY